MTDGVPPILHVIAGPNGAGKTTFYDLQLSRLTDAEFVNADRLAEAHFGHVAATQAESEQGQNLAQTRREALIEAGESLVMESTFSHPSKIDFVRDALAAGYRVVVYHLNVRNPDHAVLRVEARVAEGGHAAPADRIRARYVRNQPLIREAVLAAHRAFVFDNSALGQPPRRLLTFVDGRVTEAADDLPAWALALYGGELAP